MAAAWLHGWTAARLDVRGIVVAAGTIGVDGAGAAHGLEQSPTMTAGIVVAGGTIAWAGMGTPHVLEQCGHVGALGRRPSKVKPSFPRKRESIFRPSGRTALAAANCKVRKTKLGFPLSRE